MNTTQSHNYIPTLTGLRGFASILVFWYHARWNAGNPPILLGSLDINRMLSASDSGVAIFFVLSGFLLSLPFWRNYLDRESSFPKMQSYFIRRISRILPAYYVSLIHTHLFANVTYTFMGGVTLIAYTLGLHTFIHQSYIWGFNPVLWTIGIEIQFYMLLPCLFILAKKISWNQQFKSAKYSVLLGYSVITFICFISDSIYKYIILHLSRYTPDVFFGGLNVLDSHVYNSSIFYFLRFFWIGITICLIYQSHIENYSITINKRIPTFSWSKELLMVICLAGMLLLLVYGTEGEWRRLSLYGWPINCLFYGAIILISPFSNIGLFLFENKLMLFLGEISYGIYLWHWLIQQAVFNGSIESHFDGTLVLLIGGIISLLVTTFLASLSYFFVELPVMRFSHAINSKSKFLEKSKVL